MGDDLEAMGLAVFNWDGRYIRLKGEIELPEGEVFEALTPLVSRADNDGDPAWMLPVTTRNEGSQIRSYSYKGGRVREGRNGPLSDSRQWIHILGSAKLGDSGRPYLLTGLMTQGKRGRLELYRLDLAQTRITSGMAADTHIAGSRLLEVALIGDMDKDGRSELLAPGRDRSSLVIYSLEHSKIKAREVLSYSKRIGTNLCPGDYDGDSISDVMFGLEDGTLIVLQGE
jgi:hypothetical protein